MAKWLNVTGDEDGFALPQNLDSSRARILCLYPEPDIISGTYTVDFFLHGIRHMHPEALHLCGPVKPGERLLPLLNVQIPSTQRHGRSLRRSTGLTGYVPIFYAADFRQLLSEPLTAAEAQLTVVRFKRNAPVNSSCLSLTRMSGAPKIRFQFGYPNISQSRNGVKSPNGVIDSAAEAAEALTGRPSRDWIKVKSGQPGDDPRSGSRVAPPGCRLVALQLSDLVPEYRTSNEGTYARATAPTRFRAGSRYGELPLPAHAAQMQFTPAGCEAGGHRLRRDVSPASDVCRNFRGWQHHNGWRSGRRGPLDRRAGWRRVGVYPHQWNVRPNRAPSWSAPVHLEMLYKGCRVALSADGNTAIVGGPATTQRRGRRGCSPEPMELGRSTRSQLVAADAIGAPGKANRSRFLRMATLQLSAVLATIRIWERPEFSAELTACGARYPSWWDGSDRSAGYSEMPVQRSSSTFSLPVCFTNNAGMWSYQTGSECR